MTSNALFGTPELWGSATYQLTVTPGCMFSQAFVTARNPELSAALIRPVRSGSAAVIVTFPRQRDVLLLPHRPERPA